MRIPEATYRIQFNPSFGFKAARGIIDYLARLGITDIYASPIFKAKKGSSHGYDIVDSNQLNPELGEYIDFEELIKEAKNYRLGWLQDIVPNHMAFDSENYMLMDILEKGKNSKYFHFFDIKWDHYYESLKGRLLAPFLGKFYAESLEDAEIQLRYGENGLIIEYYDLRLPVKLNSYVEVFKHNLNLLEERQGLNNPDLIKFLGVLNLFEAVSSQSEDNEQYDQIKHAKIMLWGLYSENQQIRAFMDENITLFNGKKGDSGSFNALDNLLSGQLFRLSFWKVAAEEINYRRFFNINQLISLRVEDTEVLDYTHDLIFKLVREGKISGLRIDHLDGLYDPTNYLKKIKERTEDIYIIVEKILGREEKLPSFWPVQGTTGYDFMNKVNGLFCNKLHEKEFSRMYYEFTGLHNSYDDLVCEKKRLIIGKHMAGDIDNLAQFMKKNSSKDRYGKDITLYGLRRALVEVMAFFPVYRTYINYEIFSDNDRLYIKDAIEKARKKSPGLSYELNFIEKFLLINFQNHLQEEEKKLLIDFAMKSQQFSGPLMAKGFEDTVLYIYNKLISLNEVGGNPNSFGCLLEEFHEFNKNRGLYSLNATSTHDAKRGEDVRARINVLSEMPKEWKHNLEIWGRINRIKKKIINDKYMPDENDEYFFYQTIIGALPFYEIERLYFIRRMRDYIIKAVREAKVHTAWIKPDTEYEDACVSFVDEILRPCEENKFLGDFLKFQKKVSFYGIFNSLSQVLIKTTSPGIVDFYQGTELWDFSLVDPDNRRPVDFQKRMNFLAEIRDKEEKDILGLISELFASKEDGRIKLFLIYRLLRVIRSFPCIFKEGDYIVLKTEGKHKNCLVSYARKYQDNWAIIIAPRFFTNLVKEGELPLGEHVWGDTEIILPEGAPYLWRDALTGQIIDGRGAILIGTALKNFSQALFISSPEGGR